jgi:tetratricopeptide (TPR) repeat protein
LEASGGDWREEALYQAAWALLNLGRDAEARETSGRLAAEFPGSELPADLPFRMGEDAMAAGNFSEAISWYDRCRGEYPGTGAAERAGLRAALAAKEAGDWGEAANRYGEWLEVRSDDPRAAAAARSWADCVRSSGDPSLAASAREDAEEIFGRGHPSSAPMVLAWARVLGIPVESRRVLEEAAENEDLAPADRAEALLLTAHRYRMDGRHHRSRQLYEVLVRDVPGRIGAEAQEGLAKSLAEEGEIDAAAEAFLSVSYLYPDQADIAARSLREAEKLYREAGRDDEADAVLGKLEDR